MAFLNCPPAARTRLMAEADLTELRLRCGIHDPTGLADRWRDDEACPSQRRVRATGSRGTPDRRADGHREEGRLAAKRPAYGDEVKGLGFVDLGKGSRLAGFTSGLVLCAGWRRWRGRGPRARLLPYVAGKRVVPDSLHPGFGGDGRGCPWSLAGCDPDAKAGSPRPVSYGALGYAAAAAPFAGPSRPPLAMAGSQGVPVVRTAWS